jgi:hypothetical protein
MTVLIAGVPSARRHGVGSNDPHVADPTAPFSVLRAVSSRRLDVIK